MNLSGVLAVHSQTVEYALRAMSHLASLRGRSATCGLIARATRVPPGYLAKVLRGLVSARLVNSFRGPGGGFELARDASSISVLDIVNAVDPIHRIEGCPLDDPSHACLCPLHQCLDDALSQIEATFRRTTLGSVLKDAGDGDACRTLFTPDPPGGNDPADTGRPGRRLPD